jgi:hypothetical protein
MVVRRARLALEEAQRPYPSRSQAPLLWAAIDRARRDRVTLDEGAALTVPLVTRDDYPLLFLEGDSIIALLVIGDRDYNERVPELEALAKSILDPDDT